MSAFLPQRDPAPAGREESLRRARETYRYNYTHVCPLAILDRVPVRDEFSLQWLMTVAEKVLVGLANRAELEVGKAVRDFHLAKLSLLKTLVSSGATAVRGVRGLVADALRFDARIGAPAEPAKAIEDFAGLFRTIGLPPIGRATPCDRTFAYMRVAGPNPVMLRRVTARDDRFPVTAADFAAAAPDDSFDAALADGRLYLADYADLDGAEPGDYPHGRKYVYAPLALFVVDRVTKVLLPVAIQCRQTPGPGNPVFTPGDGYNWLIAKTIVEMADANVHEAATHLGRTHLFMEPFVVTTYRQLAPNHPVAVLLGPHFEGTLAINESAWRHLIANKGAVEKLFAASIHSSRGLAAKGVRTARVTEVMLPKTFADRGVADPEGLPNYPYRDDALLYWDAIREWVTAYLAVYYTCDGDVAGDPELQAWARELAADDGGRIAGLPNGGAFRTLAELIDVVTLVVFTSSVQHAAVNFPQYDLMSYVPHMPLAVYRPAPAAKTGATAGDYLAMLPPLDMAELQMELGFLLGTVRYTRLGHYPPGRFRDPMVTGPLAEFQRKLIGIGAKIAERNTTRRPYEFLVPDGIPQSINV